jgi:hypothetical protein
MDGGGVGGITFDELIDELEAEAEPGTLYTDEDWKEPEGELPKRVAEAAHCFKTTKGALDIINDYLDKGGNIDAQCVKPIGGTMLMLASAGGHGDLIHTLLQSRASPDVQNECGFTALHYACFFDRPKSAWELLTGGAAYASMDIRNANPELGEEEGVGLTPMDIAKMMSPDCVEELERGEEEREARSVPVSQPARATLRPLLAHLSTRLSRGESAVSERQGCCPWLPPVTYGIHCACFCLFCLQVERMSFPKDGHKMLWGKEDPGWFKGARLVPIEALRPKSDETEAETATELSEA